MRQLLAFLILSVVLLPGMNAAGGRGHGSHHRYPRYGSKASHSYGDPSRYRNSAYHAYRYRSYGYSHVRIHRSLEAKHEFWNATGHPHAWPGHVVDHIVPLACGGADAPGNM